MNSNHKQTAICCNKVSLYHGNHLVLKDVSFNISAGDFIGILGPNGAGKTTLMRALLGLLPIRSGEISIFGEPVNKRRATSSTLAYLPQLRSTLPNCSLAGYEFIAAAIDGHRFGLPFCFDRKKKQQRIDAIDEALELVNAEDLAHRPVNSLSGGERQRMLIAQCLVGSPRILLLDEPLMSLDPGQQQYIIKLVNHIRHVKGLTVLFSAHELNPLIEALDKILYLGQRQAALGTPDKVMTKDVLSRLYGAPIDVVSIDKRYFVMSRGHLMEQDHHCGID